MNKKLILIAIFGLSIPLITLTSEKPNHQTTQKYSITKFNPARDTQPMLDIFSQNHHWLAYYDSPSRYQSYLESCHYDSDCNIKVLQENQKLAGYIMYRKDLYKKGYINQVAVANDFRNKGYGKFLVSTAVKELNNMGVNNIHLDCYKDNTPALNLYKKMGFQKQYLHLPSSIEEEYKNFL